MILGLLTDTHDNLAALDASLEAFRARGVEQVLHAGDITAPATLKRLAGWPAIAVFGNNDVQRDELLEAARRSGVTLGDGWDGVLGGARVAIVHGDDKRALAHAIGSGRFDLVLTGHSHKLRDERVGRTRVVNPGALRRAARYTCGVYDTAKDRLDIIDLSPSPLHESSKLLRGEGVRSTP